MWCEGSTARVPPTPTTHRRWITGVRGSEHASDGGGHDATLHDGVEVAGGDVREVAGGGGEVGVSELGLDHVEGGGLVEEFDGEGVSQGVGVDAALDSGLGCESSDELPDVGGSEGFALVGGEDVGDEGEGLEGGPGGDESGDGVHGGSVDGDVASFVALAVSDVEGALGGIDVSDLKGQGLGDAEPGAPHDEKQGSVSEPGSGEFGALGEDLGDLGRRDEFGGGA